MSSLVKLLMFHTSAPKEFSIAAFFCWESADDPLVHAGSLGIFHTSTMAKHDVP